MISFKWSGIVHTVDGGLELPSRAHALSLLSGLAEFQENASSDLIPPNLPLLVHIRLALAYL